MSLIDNKTEFVSLHTVLSDFYDDNGIVQQDIDESLIEKWAEDKIMDISTDKQLSHKLAWISVENYKADLPSDLVIVNEIAYKKTNPSDSCDIRGYEITQYVQQTHDPECNLEINVACNKCHKKQCDCNTGDIVVDINTDFEIAHPELFYSKYLKVGRFGYGKSIYSPEWHILCRSNNDWFGLNKYLPDCANIHCRECPDTYVINPPTIETSFEKGEILISYMGRKRDVNGDIMIPKHRDVFEAILQHLTYKWFRREYIRRREASDKDIYLEAYQLAELATTKAITRIGTPSFAEFSTFWSMNKWVKMDSAYSNLLEGEPPYETLHRKQRNIYKS
jgi:hypothetical protein